MLDLYSCAGGAAMGYHRAGFDVVGFDKDPQPRYPFRFIQADVTRLDLVDVAAELHAVAAHASPPCQFATAYRRKGHGVGAGAVNLIPATRTALIATGLPWIIENVEQAASHLDAPVKLCGGRFGLDVQRHRLFESNIPLTSPGCDHSWWTPRFPPATNRTNLRKTVEVGVYRIPLAVQQAAMGIDWMKLGELSQAIPPAYTEHLGRQLMVAVGARAAAGESSEVA
jgi:DNA (cytosine-5)-methyltransferase 1